MWWKVLFMSMLPAVFLVYGKTEWGTDRRTGQIVSSVNGGKSWENVTVSGSSWFGFETQDFVVDGLWTHTMDFYLDTMKSIGINSIRVPYSSEWVLFHWDLYPDNGLVGADPEAQHKKSREILDLLLDKAAMRDMVIMLDLHRLHKEYISELWYSPTDSTYTSETWFTTWFTMLDYILPRHENVMAIDLLNEPHGQATWGSDEESTDWRLFVQGAVPRLADRYPDHKFLFFIEGVDWGHTFAGWREKNRPLLLPDILLDRVVFSPHTYGSSVVPGTTSDVNILRSNWDYTFGFLRDMGFPIAIGEWGGQTYLDQGWMNALVDYLMVKNCTNQFFWSLGPNSGDVAGILLDDWTTVDSFKKSVIQRIVM